jgi:hypothetical protein
MPERVARPHPRDQSARKRREQQRAHGHRHVDESEALRRQPAQKQRVARRLDQRVRTDDQCQHRKREPERPSLAGTDFEQ